MLQTFIYLFLYYEGCRRESLNAFNMMCNTFIFFLHKLMYNTRIYVFS